MFKISGPLYWMFNLLIVHGVLGVITAIYHHEQVKRCPTPLYVRSRYILYAVRSLFYAGIFLLIGLDWGSTWGMLAVIFLVQYVTFIWALMEIALAAWKFQHSKLEISTIVRRLHTTLAINSFVLLGLSIVAFPGGVSRVWIDLHWYLTILAYLGVGLLLLGVRDAIIAIRGRVR